MKNLILRLPKQDKQITTVYKAPPELPKKCRLKVYRLSQDVRYHVSNNVDGSESYQTNGWRVTDFLTRQSREVSHFSKHRKHCYDRHSCVDYERDIAAGILEFFSDKRKLEKLLAAIGSSGPYTHSLPA